ncbi:hypothetical protein [Flavobacterium sp. ACN6]|uniref:hypothetical protein n=1 Tax=Flavobacterium sp. ACN6 TaxID=1920426 RepID=UPI001DF7E39F|nr:hypothetical protein [Flavobacterium sp. ACN6]PBJ13635.1 hypothetical protein BSF42_11100 [Flavobacterium sp. ACN6]
MLNHLDLRLRIRNIIVETQKNKAMATNNLGTKKINGTQKDIDESKGKNVSHDKDLKDAKLKKEVVTDADGDKKIVDRARNENEDIQLKTPKTSSDNPNSNRGVSSEEEAKKTVENKDRNSDVTPDRYPNSNPESHKDRGNMKLDEDE